LPPALTENEDTEILSDATRLKNAREEAAQEKQNAELAVQLAQELEQEAQVEIE